MALNEIPHLRLDLDNRNNWDYRLVNLTKHNILRAAWLMDALPWNGTTLNTEPNKLKLNETETSGLISVGKSAFH